MKKTHLLFLIFWISSGTLFAQSAKGKIKPFLTKEEVIADLNYFDSLLQERSSYQGLNGYDYQDGIKKYLANLKSDKINRNEFGLALTRILAPIGDRHSYVDGYQFQNTKLLPSRCST